ncbi:MAG: mismatch repair protein [Acidobacteria bacterium]|nr:mismatch repair protein [Acidobacteriota bacterium]
MLAFIAVVLAWLSFVHHRLSPWWLTIPVAAFASLALYHSRILRSRDRAIRARRFYEKGLARIENRWAGQGQSGERFSDQHHEYATDLDLFGQGGLFELLCTARTRMGEETLASWLLSPSPPEQIRMRQGAIDELRDQLDLREGLALEGENSEIGVDPQALLRWAEAPNQLKNGGIQWLAAGLGGMAIATVVVWSYWSVVAPLVVVLAIEATLAYRLRKPLEEILHGSEHAWSDLSLVSGLLVLIEEQKFLSPYLRSLQQRLASRAEPPSRVVERLSTIASYSESRHNLIVRMLDIPLMYSVQLGFIAEGWRRKHGHAIRAWLTVIGEFEALISLSSYSYEHPNDPFPEITAGPAHWEASELGHPLIPASTCVRSSLSLAGRVSGLIVSGSNMSGKSTLLRAVGVNAVLAMAGAPVRAKKLEMSPLHVGASIRINDSLQDGRSRFYAEITRLRKLFDLAGSDPPLLFLLDELFEGTNSQDRLIGAQGLLRALIDRKAIGLVTTHDLALTQMGREGDRRLRNVHFQEEFDNGTMHFDYQLREGVVTRSNGLALMRSIGLDV